MTSDQRSVLVTDFDGTMTRRDFYSCVVEELLSPSDLTPWHEYTDGKITHFEALRRIFQQIRATESQIDSVLELMQFDPDAAGAIGRLRQQGWDVIVVSNGCRWYIDRFFQRYDIQVEVHSNPGSFSPQTGLELSLPEESPFFSRDVGVSKPRVVQHALDQGRLVAFAGDGRPDREAAVLVPPELRFARGWLAETLQQDGKPFHPFECWSDIPALLLSETA